LDVVILILSLVLLAVVLAVISAPLRAAAERRAGGEPDHPALDEDSPERSEAEAAREAKYREIRDAELDFRTGKLSREDYEATDRALRAEALEILNRLDRSSGEDTTPRDA
jgi:flagellar biosynthesis/type III secretory pathway M-ring protein FliF/YscJ